MSKILIIPAAGAATRLRPLTNSMSKAMLPVNGKPVIAYIIDQNIDVYDTVVVVYGQSDDLPKFIRTRYSDKLNKIKLVKQQKQTGVLSAVQDGLEILDTRSPDYLTVWLGDTIVCDYKSQFTSNEVVVSSVSDWSRWCLVDDSITYYDKPIEQPPTNKALVGIYSFMNLLDVYEQTCKITNVGIKVKNEFQMSQLLEQYTDTTKLVETKEWYDCGDFQSLYESKARLITRLSRPDNKIAVDVNRSSVTKSGPRCKNEILWYAEMEHIPSAKPYLPQLYDMRTTEDSYTIAYCPGATLQEVFAFEDLKPETVEYTLRRTLDAYFDCFGQHYIYVHSSTAALRHRVMEELIETKLDRVHLYNKQYEFVHLSEVAAYVDYANYCYNKLSTACELFKVKIKQLGHGDFHFGNILFDYNTGSVKFIDPKGPNVDTVEFYDVVKFYQSFYGDYLWIKTDTMVNQKLKAHAIEFCDKYFTNLGFDVTIIKQLVPILMGSVLQFHADRPDHQVKIWNKTMDMIYEHRIL